MKKTKLISISAVLVGTLALASCGSSGGTGVEGLKSLKGEKASQAVMMYNKEIKVNMCTPMYNGDKPICDKFYKELANQYAQKFDVTGLDKKSINQAMPDLQKQAYQYMTNQAK